MKRGGGGREWLEGRSDPLDYTPIVSRHSLSARFPAVHPFPELGELIIEHGLAR